MQTWDLYLLGILPVSTPPGKVRGMEFRDLFAERFTNDNWQGIYSDIS